MKKFSIYIILFTITISGCQNKRDDSDYKQKINTWHQKRVEDLTQPDSWLSLAGLYWLQPGTNTFGSDSSNTMVFPPNSPAHIGKFIVEDSTIHVQIEKNIPVTAAQKRVQNMVVKSDAKGEPTVFHLGSLSWYVIKRSNELGVRLKDSANKALKAFKGIERFDVDKKWRVKAHFKPYEQPKEVSVPTVTGKPTIMMAPGLLEFSIGGQTYHLQPVTEDPDDGELFVIFGDKTNGEQTYGGGRFVYVKVPDEDGITYIDFNKAYNPPCAFTAFATCPLPTPQNRISVKINAGEKKYGNHGQAVHG